MADVVLSDEAIEFEKQFEEAIKKIEPKNNGLVKDPDQEDFNYWNKAKALTLSAAQGVVNAVEEQGDFLDEKNQTIISNFFEDKLDLIVSDMAVNTTGNKNLDAISTGELSINAMEFSVRNLKKDGSFISKIFMGSTFNEIVENCKKNFKEVKVYKPPSSRKDSKESFIICKTLR